jgi:hypothetical protein
VGVVGALEEKRTGPRAPAVKPGLDSSLTCVWGGEQGLLRVNDMVVQHLSKRKKKPGPHVNYTTAPTSLDAYPGLLKPGKNTLTVPTPKP